jgi:hypothetical protein
MSWHIDDMCRTFCMLGVCYQMPRVDGVRISAMWCRSCA